MKYWYRKWALIQLIFIFFVFLAIAVVFPGLYTVSSMYWVLLIADLAITLSLSCFLARQLEPWAQDNPLARAARGLGADRLPAPQAL